jgi:type 1 glutamine amidotransferase
MTPRILTAAALLALAGFAAAPAEQKEEKKPVKRILLITESKGFQHGCVARKVEMVSKEDRKELAKLPGVRLQGDKVCYDGRLSPPKKLELKVADKTAAVVTPCLVEQAFVELGKKTGDFEVVCSQDARKEITAENLKNFDAVFFYTTGDLGLSDVQKSDLIAFVKSGKGFAGSHSATDTEYKWKEYGELIGGYFAGHPWHQKVKVIVEDTKHPATKHLGESFEITDEIYQFRAPYDRKRLRVLMRLDRAVDRTTVTLNGKNLTNKDELKVGYKDGKPVATLNGKEVEIKSLEVQGPKGNRKDGDNALAWVQEYGKGRVFYTALGHRDEVWKDKRFLDHLHGGLRYVLGLEKADATPQPASDR